jgi:hypothetical protein
VQAHESGELLVEYLDWGCHLGTWESYVDSYISTKAARERFDVVGDIMRENFGGYVLALIVVLLAYAAISMFAPQYTTGFAAVTLLGIVLFYFNKKKD